MRNKLLIFAVSIVATVAAVGLLYTTSESLTASSWEQYATTTFAVAYPHGYTADEGFQYDVAPGRRSNGVRFFVAPALADGTNLSNNSYVSVEWLPTMVACSATPYLYDPVTLPPVHEGATTYSVASASGAAAGNLYEETVYARLGEKGCMAVRYFIHSTNLGNYDAGTVRKFDKQKLLEQFDGVRRSLKLL